MARATKRDISSFIATVEGKIRSIEKELGDKLATQITRVDQLHAENKDLKSQVLALDAEIKHLKANAKGHSKAEYPEEHPEEPKPEAEAPAPEGSPDNAETKGQ